MLKVTRVVLAGALAAFLAFANAVGEEKQQGAAPKEGGSGSSASSPTAPSSSATSSSPNSTAVLAAEGATYVIGPQDVLDVSVWKEPEVSRQVPVRPDGNISLPLINDVQAVGFTPMQLAERIREKLKKYLTDAQVTITVLGINSRRIYVIGEVMRPGPQAMLPNMTVLQAISTAGGFGQFADSRKIYVLRNESGKQATYPFNYREVVRGFRPEQNIILKPGDTVVVP